MSTSDQPQAAHSDRAAALQPDATDSQATAENLRLFTLLQPAVTAQNLYLEDVSVHLAGASRTISVVVDLQEDQTGGVNLDTIAEISRALSEVMDSDPHDDGRAYDLEVSSPGTGRPLTELRHWRRARGRMVSVNVIGADNLMGRILDVDGNGVTLRPELPVKKGMKPKQGDPVTLPFGTIRRGVVEVEFSHAADEDSGVDFETGLEAAGEED